MEVALEFSGLNSQEVIMGGRPQGVAEACCVPTSTP